MVLRSFLGMMVIQPRFRGNDEGFYTMLWRYLHVDGTHRSPWRYTQIRPWTVLAVQPPQLQAL